MPRGSCCVILAAMAWPKNHSADIARLNNRISELETALANERTARLEDKIEVLKKMALIGEDLGRAVSGLRPRREPGDRVFGNARDFTQAVEREEGINVA